MSDFRRRHPARRGVTLVELLVVVGIMLLLAAITIPSMQGLTEGRRVREAARAVNVYFGRARSRAIESGRPCGVMFERLERQPNACVVLRQAEVPPPYSGDTWDSVVQPFAYFQLVFAAVMGVILFDEVIRANVAVGASIIVAAGLFTFWRERQAR